MKRLAMIFAILVFLSGCTPASTPAPEVPPAAATPLPRENTAPSAAAAAAAVPAMKSPVVQKEGPDPRWIAVIQLDGNVHMVNASTGWWTQVSEDGNGLPQAGTSPANQATYYCCMSWSSDGRLLAFRGTSVVDTGSGAQYHFTIAVYDTQSEKTRVLLQNSTPGGLAFRPGTHVLAYDEVVDAAYFAGGQPDASKARGIMGLNIDTGEISELVRPERGLWLAAPHWSPDGNVLGFVEQKQYETPGSFAQYDFQKNTYHAWDQAIGTYTFAPDGQHIAYDRLVIGTVASNNRIWVSDLTGQGEQAISPETVEPAHNPAWSPKGDQIAYLVGDPSGGPDAQQALAVQAAAATQAGVRNFGDFGSPGPLAWSADGTRLAFSAGTSDQAHFFSVTLADGAVKDMGIGYDPAWQP